MPLVTIADLTNQPAEVVANCMAWAKDLAGMYEDFIKKDEEDVSFLVSWSGAKKRSGGIHASELSGECRRPVWYSLTGVERQDSDLSPFWKKRFRMGHTVHALIQEDWRRICEKSMGLMSFEKEVRISPDLQEIAAQYDVYSSSDGVITFRDHPWGAAVMRVGLEIKTESGPQYEKLTGPKLEHTRQTCVYMKCLDIPLMWTMYTNKSNQNVVPSAPPYLFPFDHKLWSTIVDEVKDVRRLAVINEEPPRKESIICEFCGYGWACQPETLLKKNKREAGKQARAVMQKRLQRGGIRTPKTRSI